MDIGGAVKALRAGEKVAREGWNRKGIYIQMQKPDNDSTMTQDFVYIDMTGLQTDNDKAPKSRVPWLASQTDLLADDWEIVRDSNFLVFIDTSKYPDGFNISVSGMYGHETSEIMNRIAGAANCAIEGALNED